MSESDSVSDDRRCSSSDYADTSTSGDCQIGSKIATAHKILRRSEEQSNLALSSSKDATLRAIHDSTNVAKAFDAEMTKMKTLLKNKDDEITSQNAELMRLRYANAEELKSLKLDIQEAVNLAEIRFKEVALKEHDDGAYHIMRCFRHFMNCKPPLSMLAEMLSTPQDWPDLRVYHPVIPYSEKLLGTFKKLHQDKMWEIPPINEENLRSLIKTLERRMSLLLLLIRLVIRPL